jgi:uncharacterized protein (DUF952 family)
MILHMTARGAWETAQSVGRYEPASLIEEGFIHGSTFEQLEAVANELYRGLLDRVILVIDPALLQSEVRWEPGLAGYGDFPHIYGPIELAAVVRVVDFACGPDGRFKMPETV